MSAVRTNESEYRLQLSESDTCSSRGQFCSLLPEKRLLPCAPPPHCGLTPTNNTPVRSWENSSADCLHSEVGQAALSRYLKSHHRKRRLGLPKGTLPRVHLTFSQRCCPRVATRAGPRPASLWPPTVPALGHVASQGLGTGVYWAGRAASYLTFVGGSSAGSKLHPLHPVPSRFLTSHRPMESSHGGSSLSGAGSSSSHRKRPAGPESPAHGPWWARRIVRLKNDAALPPAPSVSPRIFRGGLGEAPELLDHPEDRQQAILDKEHRYWYVVRYVSSSTRCTLVPLLACGRFGGCGRRAGRVRWKPSPLKQGYERDCLAPNLEIVQAEAVSSAREQDANAWVIDDPDAELAAREQAAAARNKKRRLSVQDTQALVSAIGTGWPEPSPRQQRGERGSAGERGRTASSDCSSRPAPVRKKKKLAPASRSCLACTKGKHSAHTCGVRGKLIMEMLKEQQQLTSKGGGVGEICLPAFSGETGDRGIEGGE